MAYRTFHQEKYFDAPNIEVLPHALHELDTLQRLKAQREQHNLDLQANFDIGVKNGYFPQIQSQITEGTHALVNRLINHSKGGGQGIPDDVKIGKNYFDTLSLESGRAMDKLKLKSDQVDKQEARDPDYDGTRARALIQQSMDRSLDTPAKINDHLDKINTEDTQDYNKGGMVARYLNTIKPKEVGTDIEGADGVKRTSFKSYQLVKPNGTPGVTHNIVNDFMGSHRMLRKIYDEEVQQDIVKEINTARANGEDWVKNKTDEELFSAMHDGKSGNPKAPMVTVEDNDGNIVTDEKGKPLKRELSYGDRLYEKGKNDLLQYEHTNNKSSIDASNVNEGAKFGVTNKNYNAPTPGFNSGSISGPSWHLYKKTGTGENILPQIPASIARVRYNNDTGKYEDTGESQVPFSMTSFQWGPVDSEGKPVVLKDSNGNTAKDVDDQIRIINEKPLSDFKPGGISGVKVIFNGRSTDKAQTLNLAYKAKELNDLARANPDDRDAQNNATQFGEALANMQQGKEFDSQMFQKFMGTDFIKNQSFATTGPDDPNVKSIEGQTGMNVYNPKLVTEGTKRLQAAINARVAEASKHTMPKDEVNPQPAKKGVKQPTEEMVTVISPEGQSGRVPKSKLDAALKAGFKQQ